MNILRLLTALPFLVIGTASTASAVEIIDPTPTVESQTSKVVVERLMENKAYKPALRRALKEVKEDFSIESVELLLRTNYDVSNAMIGCFKHRDLSVFDYDNMSHSKAKELKVDLPKDEEVEEIISVFDTQRETLEAVIALLEVHLEATASEKHYELYLQAKKRLSNLANIRTQYISYNIISPYLCEAYRIAYIARGFFDDDEEGLFKAARYVAKGCHKEWIYQATPKVQQQFVTVISYIKHNMSADEWAAACTETTLTPSLDPSKVRGARAWLEKEPNQK